MANRKTMGAVILDETITSSNMASPLRRRSIAATPLSRLRKDLVQNDDESEILARRRQPQVTDSPQSSDTSDRRVSLGLVGGLSSNEITEHYVKCMKMCAENKINAKNVFSLSMIDYISVLSKRDLNSNNMQTAGTTLDVSTKIYGLRVDCVYSEVLKMAGDPAKQDNINKESENAEDTANVDGTQEDPEAKKIKKRRVQKIHCTSESLFANADVLVLRPTANNSDSQTTDLMLQAVFPIHTTSGYSLHLFQDVLLDFPAPIVDEMKGRNEVTVPVTEDYEDSHICPMFADFHFHGWSENDVPENYVPPSTGADSPTNDNFRFDLDASIVDTCGNDYDVNGLNYFDMKDGDPPNPERCGRMGRDSGEQIVDFVESVAIQDQQKTLEYSYLQKCSNNLHWAGPGHWKPRLLNRILTETKEVGACRQQGGRKKKEINLDYNNDVEASISDGMKSKMQKKLQIKTVKQSWQEDKLTLPEDIHYDNENPTKFYYHSFRRIPLNYGTKPGTEIEAADHTTIIDNEVDYNYDNFNDTQDYCSQNNKAEEGVGESNEDIFDNNDQDGIENQNPNRILLTQGFIGDNLVAAPKSTQQLSISYTSRAKKIDMRQLKHGLWKCLTMENIENGNGVEEAGAVKMKDERSFSEIYKKLPNVLRKDNTEALSLALAFSSLLHLGNEKNLSITSTLDMSDLKVQQA